MCLFGERGRSRGRQPARSGLCCFFNKSLCWKRTFWFCRALVKPQVPPQNSCCRSFMPSAPAWWWGQFLVLRSPSICTPFPARPFPTMRWHFLTGSWFYLLLANWPSKSSFEELQWKTRRFQPNGGWLLWLNKGVGQVFVVWMSLSEFTTCKPISLSQTNSSCRGSHSKAFVPAAGEWEGWGTTEVPKCLIATNFNRGCPKCTSRDAYQRQRGF